MKIFCHNRPMAQAFASNHTGPLTIISITDPGQLQPQFPQRHTVHRFEFLDIEFDAALRQTDGGLYLVGSSAKSDGPTQELAAQLAEVIRSVQGDLLVHCEQGRSRSVAVALAAHISLGVPLNIWHPQPSPNQLLAVLLDAELDLNGGLIVLAQKLTDCIVLQNSIQAAADIKKQLIGVTI